MNHSSLSPFVDSHTPIVGNNLKTDERESYVPSGAASPFLQIFESPGRSDLVTPRHEAFVSLVDDFFDEEMEEALEDLAQDAASWHEGRSNAMSRGNFTNQAQPQQLLEQHYAPFLQEVEQLLEQSALLGEQYDSGALTDVAFGAALDQYHPMQEFESPHFEQIFGRIKNAVKKAASVVKKGVSAAAQMGLGPILKKLKGYVMGFLKGFLEKSMNRVPEQLRPFAEKLRDKYIGKPKAKTSQETGGAGPMQEELNIALAEMLMGESRQDLDFNLESYLNENAQGQQADTQRMLERARERLVQQLDGLEEGESPKPAVEEFVSTVLLGLKWAIKLIGRPRVKDFLVEQLTRITSSLVDGKNAKLLSKLIVDQGFSMLNLEASVSNRAAMTLSHEAVATTLEDTLLHVAQIPEHLLRDEVLLEGYLMEAFEASATANLPDMLTERTYEQNPNLRESNKRKLFWAKRQRHVGGNLARYKKLNQEPEVELTPYIMEEVKTFNGVSLAAFLRDSMGVDTRTNLPVRIKMFEILPGGGLLDIAKQEISYPSGLPARIISKQIHPLTSVAAGLLLGEPKVGCKMKGKCLAGSLSGQQGHRYYYLDIPNTSPQTFTRQDGKMALRRPSQVRLKLDFVQGHIGLLIFFSEADAQAITAGLRNDQMAKAQFTATKIANEGLKRVFKYPENAQLTMVHPLVMPGPQSGLATRRIPPVVLQSFQDRLSEWMLDHLTANLRTNGRAFAEATANDDDGLTIHIKLAAPDGFDLLYGYIAGQSSGLSTRLFTGSAPAISVHLQSDYRYE